LPKAAIQSEAPGGEHQKKFALVVAKTSPDSHYYIEANSGAHATAPALRTRLAVELVKSMEIIASHHTRSRAAQYVPTSACCFQFKDTPRRNRA
jgi:hypothetical protein